jgi:hypothetical protein
MEIGKVISRSHRGPHALVSDPPHLFDQKRSMAKAAGAEIGAEKREGRPNPRAPLLLVAKLKLICLLRPLICRWTDVKSNICGFLSEGGGGLCRGIGSEAFHWFLPM